MSDSACVVGGDNQTKYYLLGTPIIWWAGSTSLVVSITVLGIYLLRQQRKYKDFEPGKLMWFVLAKFVDINSIADEWEHFLYVWKVATVGWLLHFLPFLVMGRVTYIHHYVRRLMIYASVVCTKIR